MSAVWGLPLVAFSGFLVIHVVWWRLLSHGGRGIIGLWPLCGIAVSAYLLVSLLWAWRMPGSRLEHHWLTVPVYACAVMWYLHFYYAVLRSVSVRCMGELVQLGGGPIPLDVLKRRYPTEQLLHVRLDSLIQAGWVTEREGRYRLLPRGARMACFADRLKRLYRLETSG